MAVLTRISIQFSVIWLFTRNDEGNDVCTKHDGQQTFNYKSPKPNHLLGCNPRYFRDIYEPLSVGHSLQNRRIKLFESHVSDLYRRGDIFLSTELDAISNSFYFIFIDPQWHFPFLPGQYIREDAGRLQNRQGSRA